MKTRNLTITILWNYDAKSWEKGTKVEVIGTGLNKYLRTIQDETVIDNLAHLIDYGSITDDLV